MYKLTLFIAKGQILVVELLTDISHLLSLYCSHSHMSQDLENHCFMSPPVAVNLLIITSYSTVQPLFHMAGSFLKQRSYYTSVPQ
jgi:hypothetical protein